ncbi:MAG TPA: PAS domain S-box protein, partial [Blastocatellia bacterium]|nr:PAS domain S-box protein [Blastocatellia bacterium]
EDDAGGVGKPLGDILDLEGESSISDGQSLVQQIMRQGSPVVLPDHTILVSRDGRRIPVDAGGAPLKRADGTAAGVIIVFQDVSERRQNEQALRRSEARLAGILNIADDAVISINEKQTIILFNEGAQQVFGYSRDEVLGHPLSMLLPERFHEHGRDVELFRQSKDVVRKMGERREIFGRRKDGAEFPAEASISKLETSDERVLTVMLRDITERKRTEEALRHSEEQLRQSQKMEAVGRLAGGIAHDFNNLLTAIIGYSELASLRINPADPISGNLDEIAKAAQRAASLTAQLLAFSRKQMLQPRVLDLSEQVRDIEEMLRRVIGEDIDLITILDSELWRVRVDPNQVQQVIVNLAVNARDAMPEGGTLTIETANIEVDEQYAQDHPGAGPGPHVLLAITDTGVGMNKETKEHIFEPFFTTKEMGKGTGLGLSTVYGIIRQSGGNVWVSSEPGKGSSFTIILPAIQSPEHEAERTVLSGSVTQGQETVLVVEDQETVLKLVRDILEHQGYRVLHALRPSDAITICNEYDGPIHLMITDVIMPQMNGRQLADYVAPTRPDMRVLFMSGYTDNAMVKEGILGPGAAFIQKPFQMSSLLYSVRDVLGKTKRRITKQPSPKQS